MKPILPILFLLSFACSGQVDTNAYIGVPVLKSKNISVKLYYPLVIEPTWEYENRKVIMTGQIYKGGKPYAVMSGETMITENLLLHYADECYNDSTVWVEHFYFGPPRKDEYHGSGYENQQGQYSCNRDFLPCSRKSFPDHYTKKVIHRKPTFENFIEWLRNK